MYNLTLTVIFNIHISGEDKEIVLFLRDWWSKNEAKFLPEINIKVQPDKLPINKNEHNVPELNSTLDTLEDFAMSNDELIETSFNDELIETSFNNEPDNTRSITKSVEEILKPGVYTIYCMVRILLIFYKFLEIWLSHWDHIDATSKL